MAMAPWPVAHEKLVENRVRKTVSGIVFRTAERMMVEWADDMETIPDTVYHRLFM